MHVNGLEAEGYCSLAVYATQWPPCCRCSLMRPRPSRCCRSSSATWGGDTEEVPKLPSARVVQGHTSTHMPGK